MFDEIWLCLVYIDKHIPKALNNPVVTVKAKQNVVAQPGQLVFHIESFPAELVLVPLGFWRWCFSHRLGKQWGSTWENPGRRQAEWPFRVPPNFIFYDHLLGRWLVSLRARSPNKKQHLCRMSPSPVTFCRVCSSCFSSSDTVDSMWPSVNIHCLQIHFFSPLGWSK